MQLTEMKKLYATGDWICVTKGHAGWFIEDVSRYGDECQFSWANKLIHKKHADVLDHVLKGGEVSYFTGREYTPLKDILATDKHKDDDFFTSYNPEGRYEIIKDKPDLNDHYCLATKEHKEEFKPIEGYEEYSISSFGKVLGKTGKEMKPQIGNSGYLRVQLSRSGKTKKFYVHRLVALSFIENKEDKNQVNHIDGNKVNNSVSNLEWCTQSENMVHAVQTGLHKSASLGKLGKDCPNSKPITQKSMNGDSIKTFHSAHEAGRETGINASQIAGVANKRKGCYTAGGYKWDWVFGSLEHDEQVFTLENYPFKPKPVDRVNCKWIRIDEDEFGSIFNSECGFDFSFTEERENLTDDNFTYCPKCSKKIVEANQKDT